MKKAQLLLLFLPLFSISQRKNFIGLSAGTDFIQNTNSFNIHASYNFMQDQNDYVGFGVGAVKFANNSSIYIPLFANLTIAPNSDKTIYPIIFIQPGYGIYSNNGVNGAFTMYSGGGVGVREKRSSTALTVGWAHYTFRLAKQNSQVDGISLRLSFLL